MKVGAKGRLAVLNARRSIQGIMFDIDRMIEFGGSMFGWGSDDQDDAASESKPKMDGHEDEFKDFHDSM